MPGSAPTQPTPPLLSRTGTGAAAARADVARRGRTLYGDHMAHSRHSRHTASAVIAVVLAGVLGVPAPALAAAPSPAARAGVAAAPADISAAQADIAAAEQAAADAATAALTASAAAAEARADAASAAATLAALELQSRAAEEAERAERRRFGMVAAEWYRTRSTAPLLAQLLTAAEPDDLLARLGVLEQVTGASARSAAAVREAADTLGALRAQAAAADAERRRLAAEADAAAAAAEQSAANEAAALAAARRDLDAAFARLAAARGTTVARERQTRQAERTAVDVAAPGGAGGGSTATPAPPLEVPSPTPALTPAEAQAHARAAVAARGWDEAQFACLVALWNRESGWRWDALNRSSGAYGIPQALPASKMASAGADWRTSAATQIAWGLSYISGRYAAPCGAWEHSQRRGWY